MHQRNKPAANRIADRNRQKRLEHRQRKVACQREVEHVGDAVFESAQDKDHDGEEHGKNFSDLVFDGLVTVGRDEHEHAAKDSKHQKAQGAVAVLDDAKGIRLGLERGTVARGGYHFGKQECSDKVAEPDDRKESPVIGFLVDEIADFPCEKVESEIQDRKKSKTEEERS